MDQDEINKLVVGSVAKAEEFLLSGLYAEAAWVIDQVLAVDPESHEAILVRALIEAYQGYFPQSKQDLFYSLEKRPDDFRAYNNLGLVFAMEGDHRKARHFFQEAAARTSDVGPVINLALELDKTSPEKAEELFVKFLDNPVAQFNYAGFLHRHKRLEEAERKYRKILSLRQDKIVECNLAKICLLTGRLKEGFKLLESRWEAFPHLKKIKSQLRSPFWDGTPDKRIVLFCEEGLGDYLQFIRYAKKLKEISQEIYIDVGDNLREAWSELGLTYYSGQKVDFCCSVLSLPRLLGTEILPPSSIKPAYFSFDKYSGFKVGLSWCGSPNHPDDLSRSIHLREFENLTRTDGTKWFTCGWAHGKKIRNGKVVNWEDGSDNVCIVDTGPFQLDVSKTSGIINGLDLVITVDTATVHIAGSLGKETWLLLPHNGEWRWGQESTTPWYPTVKIFRQQRPNDWSGVLAEVQKLLQSRVQ